jgi:hypothetical protein
MLPARRGLLPGVAKMQEFVETRLLKDPAHVVAGAGHPNFGTRCCASGWAKVMARSPALETKTALEASITSLM